uniref:KIF-binding protein n=1 Tax=Alexandrium monilatum TaxID=311494 RepID=A0A7S4QIA9_9DINO
MPYTRGDRIPEPASRRGRMQVSQRAEGKSAVEAHFATAQEIEPRALQKLKSGEMHEALELFTQVKKEIAEAVYAAGPGSPNYSMLMEAAAATQQNIDFVQGYLPYEFLMEPKKQ